MPGKVDKVSIPVEFPEFVGQDVVREITNGGKRVFLSPVTPLIRYDGTAPIDYKILEEGIDLTDSEKIKVKCPYGEVGSQLFVREPFLLVEKYGEKRVIFKYKSQDAFGVPSNLFSDPAAMCREYSRILLKIKRIRVMRISDLLDEYDTEEFPEAALIGECGASKSTLKSRFDSKFGEVEGGFNPYVWVVKFKIKKVKSQVRVPVARKSNIVDSL